MKNVAKSCYHKTIVSSVTSECWVTITSKKINVYMYTNN